MISGGKVNIEKFRGGWAKHAGFGKAHYFDEYFDAVCGAKVFPFFHIGDWAACKRCSQKRGNPTIREREHGRNMEAEMMLLRHIEQQSQPQ